MSTQRAPDRCGVRAPENIGRCVLTAGHTGQHWNAGGGWGVERVSFPRVFKPKPDGSAPMHGTIADVHALHDAVVNEMAKLVANGARWPE